MDPEATVAAIRDILKRYDAGDYEVAESVLDELATHVAAIDTWMTNGGFLPPQWMRHRE